jgi:hypothetical protein
MCRFSKSHSLSGLKLKYVLKHYLSEKNQSPALSEREKPVQLGPKGKAQRLQISLPKGPS